jgi:hypothetical protein
MECHVWMDHEHDHSTCLDVCLQPVLIGMYDCGVGAIHSCEGQCLVEKVVVHLH